MITEYWFPLECIDFINDWQSCELSLWNLNVRHWHFFTSESHISVSYMSKFNMCWIYHSYSSHLHYSVVCIFCINYWSCFQQLIAPTLNFDIMDRIIFQVHGLTSSSFMFHRASSPISNFIEPRIHGRALLVLDFGLGEYYIFLDGMSRQT